MAAHKKNKQKSLDRKKMADTLRRMLDSGKLTEEQCLSILRGLDLDKEVGGCTSEITTPVHSRKRKKKAIQGTNEEEEEKAVIRSVDNRKSLLELLDIRKLSVEDRNLIFGKFDEALDEEFFEQDVVDYDTFVYQIEDYHRQIQDSQRFDLEPGVRIPRLEGISPFYFGENEEPPPTEMVLYGRLGVHWFNFVENRDLKFIRIPKLNTEHPFAYSYYITVDVKDVNAADSLTLQTLVSRPFFPELKFYIERCRIKPTTVERDTEINIFHVDRVDEFYQRCMPTFLSEPPEEADDDALRFYEVQDKDLVKYDWLRLYTEFALFRVCEAGSHSFLPEEMVMKKILVETLETHTEPSLKLMSMNAIFHISFRANSCDYTSVVRRTTDGISRHMFLEVDSHRKET